MPTHPRRCYRVRMRTLVLVAAASFGGAVLATACSSYSSSPVLIPDTPRASLLPVVVASHGSRGQAGKCAPSKNDPAGSYVEPDFVHQVYPLVGAGYAVIAPDLAGYANYGAANNPPSV